MHLTVYAIVSFDGPRGLDAPETGFGGGSSSAPDPDPRPRPPTADPDPRPRPRPPGGRGRGGNPKLRRKTIIKNSVHWHLPLTLGTCYHPLEIKQNPH